MFGRTAERDTATTQWVGEPTLRARGGVSGGAVMTGVVVAFGAMALLTVLIAAVLVGFGLQEETISEGDALRAGAWTGVGLVVAQFLSYLWGGYTAGRMARGSGLANGILVPVIALVIAAVAGVIAASIGYSVNISLPFSSDQLPLDSNVVQNWGIGLGIASLVAMFLGGAVGGAGGQRWHTKLENRVFEEEVVEEPRSIDLREDTPTTGTRAPAFRGGAAANSPATPPPPPETSTTAGSYSTNSGTTQLKR